MPSAMTVIGPSDTIGIASTYDLPSSGKFLSSAVLAHLRVSSAETLFDVIPWPPRSTHGVAPRDGQLSSPRALLTAIIDSVISFATAGASLPAPGAGLAAPSAMNAAARNGKVACMVRSLLLRLVAQPCVGFACDGPPHESMAVLALMAAGGGDL